MIDLKKANFFEKMQYLNADSENYVLQGEFTDFAKESLTNSFTIALNALYGLNGLGRPLNIAGFVTAAVGSATWIAATGPMKVAQAVAGGTQQMQTVEAIENTYHGMSHMLPPDPLDELSKNPNLGQNIGTALLMVGTLAIMANKFNAALDYAIIEKEKRRDATATPSTTLDNPMLMDRISPAHTVAHIL